METIGIKNSFFLVVRVLFVFSSIYFMNNTLYGWGGYSYYMKFSDFLPHLSLAFIIWTVMYLTTALIFWLIIYLPTVILPKSMKFIRFEYLAAVLFIVCFFILIKHTLINVPIHDLIGVDSLTTYIAGIILLICSIAFFHSNIKKMLFSLNKHISPLIWFFAVLFILAVPFSLFKNVESNIRKHTLKDASYAVSSEVKHPNIIFGLSA